MDRHRTRTLFGGALFAAGMTANPALAQEFDFSMHMVDLQATGTPAISDDGPGFWGPLTNTGTACIAYSYGGPTDIIVEGGCVGAPLNTSTAVVLAYFTVDAPALLQVMWDFTGVPDGAPTFVEMTHGTTGATVVYENANAVGQPPTGVSGAILEADQLYAVVAGVWCEGAISQIWLSLSPAPCFADCNNDGALNVDDIDCFVAAFLAGDPNSDCDGNGALNIDDIDCFIAAFLDGCG